MTTTRWSCVLRASKGLQGNFSRNTCKSISGWFATRHVQFCRFRTNYNLYAKKFESKFQAQKSLRDDDSKARHEFDVPASWRRTQAVRNLLLRVIGGPQEIYVIVRDRSATLVRKCPRRVCLINAPDRYLHKRRPLLGVCSAQGDGHAIHGIRLSF